jgi:hypothetical protein
MSTPSPVQGFTRAVFRGLFALAAFAIAVGAAAQSPVRNIDVTYDGETYFVKAKMFAPVNLAIAWDVLTDFPHMPGWIPNLIDSAIIKQGDKQMTIEQHGNAKFGALSFPYTSQREIVLNPQKTILSTQVKGSMKRQKSLMTLTPEADGTGMLYELEVVPSFLASTVLSPDFLKHEMQEQFTAIVGEMVKRKK